MPYKDPEKDRASKKRYYEANKGKMIGRSTQWKRDQRKKIRETYLAAKDRPCEDCGIKYPSCVMDFDHVRGVKESTISQMVGRACSIERLQAEIEKCEVVCANCHRIRTWITRK